MNYNLHKVLLDEVFLHKDMDESNPAQIYLIENVFHAVLKDGKVRKFVLTKPLAELANNIEIKKRILDYRGIPNTISEVLCMEDVFMQGEFTKEIEIYKVAHLLGEKTSVFNTDEEFVEFANLICKENEDDNWFAIHNAVDAKDYIKQNCSNLKLL